MDEFFTKKELAKRWKCSESSINQMICDGTLKPSRKLPGVRFSANQILKIEEASPEELSLIEQRKLKSYIAELEKENSALKATLHKVWSPLVDFMKEVG